MDTSAPQSAAPRGQILPSRQLGRDNRNLSPLLQDIQDYGPARAGERQEAGADVLELRRQTEQGRAGPEPSQAAAPRSATPAPAGKPAGAAGRAAIGPWTRMLLLALTLASGSLGYLAWDFHQRLQTLQGQVRSLYLD